MTHNNTVFKRVGSLLTIVLILAAGNAFSQFEYKKIPSKYRDNSEEYYANSVPEIDKLDVVYLSSLLPKNHVTDASRDYTEIIQSAINSYRNIVFPSFPILISGKGLVIHSNSNIIFQKDSKLVLKPNNLKSYAVLSIRDQRNINIYYPNIEGDRMTHLSSEGEWGMGISIYGGKNIKIISPRISKCWGDGIYIANSKRNNTNNILVKDAFLDYNRRNGLTIVGGNNITIASPTISNTMGTMPMCGIDIEANKGGGIINNVSITNFIAFNNGSTGLQVGLSRYPDVYKKKLNITVKGYVSDSNPYGIRLGGFYPDYHDNTKDIEGLIVLQDIKVIDATEQSVKIGRNYNFSLRIKFEDLYFGDHISNNNLEMESFKLRASKHSQISVK